MKKAKIPFYSKKTSPANRGLSLVEMLVALSLLSVGALSFFGVFGVSPGDSKRQSPFARRQPLPRASPDPQAEELLPGDGDDGPRLRLALFHPGPL
ncbi:MAG: prepilin-type N-terminal cleavage/methylation domain-containing protein [Elusimicrobia bacterium]|nr:prepilin-type N-terminal cleavage/methylation domain-containing protein [Elusimicrobiota bacterium]